MKLKTKQLQISILSAIICISVSCKKNAGPGGQASVTGKVYAYDFDNTYNYLISQGYSVGTKVYIIYGNNTDIGNNLVTSYDGSFEFKYLNKGHYKVFAASVDTSYKVKGNNSANPVIMEFDIKNAKEKITLADIVINKQL